MDNRLTLLDTSAFIEFSRDGSSTVADDVDAVIARGLAAVCSVVAAEVLSGCRTLGEYREMELLLSGLEWLPVTDECWTRAAALGYNLRRAGITVPLTDRLIAVIARLHGADLLHCDAHFALIGEARDEVG